ncbi:MAG: hypothetical protein IJS83_02255 [Acholeplasmatales bacterium]|nr:hypothetical protein [Acholeplasmatales bacterium]
MLFKKKEEFTLYTDDLTIKRNALVFKNKAYEFDDNGYLTIIIKPGTYTFYSCNQELIYNFNNSNRLYYVYREDNDCHFNILVKDIEKNSL